MRGEGLGPIVGYARETPEEQLCEHLATLISDLVYGEERARIIATMLPAPYTDETGRLQIALQEASQSARWLLDRARARMFDREPRPAGSQGSNDSEPGAAGKPRASR